MFSLSFSELQMITGLWHDIEEGKEPQAGEPLEGAVRGCNGEDPNVAAAVNRVMTGRSGKRR